MVSDTQLQRYITHHRTGKLNVSCLYSKSNEVNDIGENIVGFLITYRTAVNTSTGETPSMLMLGSRIRTRLDLVRPTAKNYKLESNVIERSFEIGQLVSIRDYRKISGYLGPSFVNMDN